MLGKHGVCWLCTDAGQTLHPLQWESLSLSGGCGGGTPAAGWSYIASIGLTSETLRAYRNDDDPTQHGTCATETRAIFAVCPAPQKVAPRAHTTISVLLFAVAMHQRITGISAVMAPLEFGCG